MDANCSFETAVVVWVDASMQRLAFDLDEKIFTPHCLERSRRDPAADSNYPVSSFYDSSVHTK
jgi:hypothetical protein